ncbi:Replication factor A protein 1 [Coemansia sp. S17]|nr:Replication factor A protein 1 [Coemansia sp. S17]
MDSQHEETSERGIVTDSGSISPAQASPLEQPQRPSAKRTGTPYTLKQISKLNYGVKNYTIRARITKKTSIDCQAFAVNLHDDSGDIRAFIYAEQVDEFFPLLEVGNVYHISLAQIRRRNNQLELVINDKTTVERYDELTDVSRGDFDFVPIALLTENKVNNKVDILCVVKDVIDASPITTGTGKDKRVRRSLLVIDSSGYEVRITLWGSMATDFKCPVGSIVAFKGALIKDYGGRTLSASEYKPMVVNPDIPEAHTLRGWYDAEGHHKKFLSLSRCVTRGRPAVGSAPKLVSIAKANSLVAGVADNFEFFHIAATVTGISSDPFTRPSCSGKDCDGKVSKMARSDKWHCERCKQSLPNFEQCYDFCFDVSDGIDHISLQCTNKVGEILLGTSANEMFKLWRANRAEFDKKIDSVKNKYYVFKCMTTTEHPFKGTIRKVASVITACPIE